MSVQLHPDIETLDKESLCYSIYAQLYHNFFNAQQKKDDEHPYGIEEGDETSLRLKNTAYGFASAIAGAVTGEGGSGSGGLLLDYLKKSGGDMTGKLSANYGFEAGIGNTPEQCKLHLFGQKKNGMRNDCFFISHAILFFTYILSPFL